MKFIFPQNYNFKSKLFGIIDYSSAVIVVIFGVIILGVINLFFSNLNIKIFLFVTLFFPVLIFSIVGFNGENIICVFNYLVKYAIKPKVLLYKKLGK